MFALGGTRNDNLSSIRIFNHYPNRPIIYLTNQNCFVNRTNRRDLVVMSVISWSFFLTCVRVCSLRVWVSVCIHVNQGLSRTNQARHFLVDLKHLSVMIRLRCGLPWTQHLIRYWLLVPLVTMKGSESKPTIFGTCFLCVCSFYEKFFFLSVSY